MNHDADCPRERRAQRLHCCECGGNGSYENVSEYIRDLIRRDKGACGEGSVRPAEGRAQPCLCRARAVLQAAGPGRGHCPKPDLSGWLLSASKEAASHRLDEIYRYTRDHWGTEQADRTIVGLFEAFEKIEAHGVISRPVPAEFGAGGYFFRYERHFVYGEGCRTAISAS
jgi:plasmid stabilization system protein ParE